MEALLMSLVFFQSERAMRHTIVVKWLGGMSLNELKSKTIEWPP